MPAHYLNEEKCDDTNILKMHPKGHLRMTDGGGAKIGGSKTSNLCEVING